MLNFLLKKEIFFVKFPIFFPLIYFTILYLFPAFETQLIFITIILLAETHFGATWPFFLNKVNFPYIKQKKINLIIIPILVVFFCLIGFFLFKKLFLLIFFAANMYHVTRQSFGISNLYNKNPVEKKNYEILIYITNFAFFLIAFFRFYMPLIKSDQLVFLNIFILLIIAIIFLYQIIKFKFSENFLILVTGVFIFYPVCFVGNPVHAIIMGVTMHYTQYLYLTHKVYKKREEVINKPKVNIFSYKYLIIIFIYSIIMSVFSISGKLDLIIFKSLIIIPITGQMLHFYLDSQLWKFSEQHNRENILNHLKI